MSNTHEYVVFDRAKLDPALAMRWPAFDKAYPGWGQWESARDFLVEWGLSESNVALVDEIIARKTLRTTMLLDENPFHILWAILDSKGLSECGVDVDKGDYDYGEDIVSCAGAAFARGDLSLASLAAVCQLHASRLDPAETLLPDVAKALQGHPAPPPMLPGFSDMMPAGADGIGVSQARRVIDFFRQAWRERWPLQAEGQTPRNGESIRSCAVADSLAKALRNRRLSKPCMFRWFEC